MENAYFRVLPEETRQALGKAAYDAFLHHEPAFAFRGEWKDINPDLRIRWQAVVESIFNQVETLEGHVSTQLELFNRARDVLDSAIRRFEDIRPADTNLNNYQLLEWLRSANAEVINARLLLNRADIEAGRHQDTGDETTARVSIPNVKNSE